MVSQCTLNHSYFGIEMAVVAVRIAPSKVFRVLNLPSKIPLIGYVQGILCHPKSLSHIYTP